MEQDTPGDLPQSNTYDLNSTVWPPPPTGQPQSVLPQAVCPFKWTYRRAPGNLGAKACIADLREGVLQFDTEGIIIQGKAVPRAEIRTPILVFSILVSLLLAIVANSIMEYGFRRDQYLGIRWADVKEILLASDKQQACLIYDAPNYAGKIKTFSLALTPAPGFYDVLAQAVRRDAPVSIVEDRLRTATSPLVLVLLGLLILVFAAAIFFALLSPHH